MRRTAVRHADPDEKRSTLVVPSCRLSSPTATSTINAYP